MILEVVKAITAAQQGSGGASSIDAGRTKQMSEDALRKSEEAMRKSEEAMRKTEDLLRRLQDEAEKTRSAEQHTRRLEEQVEALKRQQQQAEVTQRQQLESVRDELRREREERSSLVVKQNATVDMLQLRLEATQKVADEAMKAVEDKKVDRILERVENFGEKVERRFDAWEALFENRQGTGQRALPTASATMGGRIAAYQHLHLQSTGRRINGGPAALDLQPASGSGDGASAEVWTRRA